MAALAFNMDKSRFHRGQYRAYDAQGWAWVVYGATPAEVAGKVDALPADLVAS